MLAKIPSAVLHGYDGLAVTVEVHVSNGMPGYRIVGLPDASCREARDRVRAAILSSGLKFPSKKVTINLAPSGVRKIGGGLDLPIALGLLAASNQIPMESIDGLSAVGELGLDGEIKGVPGVMCQASAIQAKKLIAPSTASEAAWTFSGSLLTAKTLAQVVAALRGDGTIDQLDVSDYVPDQPAEPDMADVLDQPVARKGIEIAAAGGHHILMVGPPGAGKTMLARRLRGLLPDLSPLKSIETSKIHSAAGFATFDTGLMRRPPLRAPHHGASLVGLLGGGAGLIKPGEISGAHGGVLFLDELGEYSPRLIEALRTPLEEGVIRVSRVSQSIEMPADFLLVASMNPCPCGKGFEGCRCSIAAKRRYARRLSGPFLDRFDLRIEMTPPAAESLFANKKSESSSEIANRVSKVRDVAELRGVVTNSKLDGPALNEFVQLSDGATSMLSASVRAGRLSARGATAVQRVALTVADLRHVQKGTEPGPSVELSQGDIATALSMRSELESVFEGVDV